MELCIYLDEKGIDILGYKRLKVFDAGRFNDPYEFMIFRDDNNKGKKELRKKIMDIIDKRKLRVIFFSKNYNNILMWGHYTNKHKGLIIKFETDKLKFEDESLNPNNLFPVNYETSPCKISDDFFEEWKKYEENNPLEYKSLYRFSKNPDSSRFIPEVFVNAITTKYTDWKYEQEYRLFFDGNSFFEGWVDINAESIVEVVMGCNMDMYYRSVIKTILRRDEYKHVVLKGAYKSPYKYEMDYIEER